MTEDTRTTITAPGRTPDTAPGGAAWPAEFDDLLRAELPLLGPGAPLAPDDFLLDLGLDSMGAVSVITGIEDLYGISLDEELLDPELLSTAAHLWATVERLRTDG